MLKKKLLYSIAAVAGIGASLVTNAFIPDKWATIIFASWGMIYLVKAFEASD